MVLRWITVDCNGGSTVVSLALLCISEWFYYNLHRIYSIKFFYWP